MWVHENQGSPSTSPTDTALPDLFDFFSLINPLEAQAGPGGYPGMGLQHDLGFCAS